MNLQQISDIFSVNNINLIPLLPQYIKIQQLKKLDKSNLQDTDKYKQIYEQIKNIEQLPVIKLLH